jgi:hypothetical protein
MLAEQERDLFLQKFQKYLLSESPRPSLDHPASNEATTVCRNLGTYAYIFVLHIPVIVLIHYSVYLTSFAGFAGSLSHYAKSLIPNNLLNEEDVQLLRWVSYHVT